MNLSLLKVTNYLKMNFGYLGGRGNYQAVSYFRGDSFHFYTPGIYADGYIVFVFPFVCSFVRS